MHMLHVMKSELFIQAGNFPNVWKSSHVWAFLVAQGMRDQGF